MSLRAPRLKITNSINNSEHSVACVCSQMSVSRASKDRTAWTLKQKQSDLYRIVGMAHKSRDLVGGGGGRRNSEVPYLVQKRSCGLL